VKKVGAHKSRREMSIDSDILESDEDALGCEDVKYSLYLQIFIIF
jgi:hypothetical protein